jgi:hypothetical protein
MLHSLKDACSQRDNFWNKINSFNKIARNNCGDITPQRWYDYFRGLFNDTNFGNDEFSENVSDFLFLHDSECDICSNEDASIGGEMLNRDISMAEISDVINHLPNGKSPGVDGILYEMIKTGSDTLMRYMHMLFNSILRTGQFPDMWCEAIITPLHKKGSRNEESNYRGISLLSCMGKIFTKVLNNRLMDWAELHNKLDEGQGAYRRHRSTCDNIFNLYAMTQKYLCKKGGRFYCEFIDFSQAFDSIPHQKLWYRLITEGIHGRILKIFRSMYSKLKSCVKTPGGLTMLFSCLKGTRQGCMISPLLFILYINILAAMCSQSGNHGIYMNETYPSVHLLMYADDLAMINDTVGRLQAELNTLSTFCRNYGLRVNNTKTKIMVFRNGGTLRQNEKWFYQGKRVETVTYYKYLGITFSSRLKWGQALKTLALQSKRALIKINTIFGKCGDMPLSIGLELFDKLVVPILLYGSEVWGCEYREEIEIVQRKYCKLLLGVASSTSNDVVLGEVGRLPLYSMYVVKCIKFWFKLVRAEHCYIKSSYDVLKKLDDAGKHTWVSQVKNTLVTNGFGDVWIAQGVGNLDMFINIFKQRICDISKQTWFSNIVNNTMYCSYKFTLEPEVYLSEVAWRRHRVAFARLRTGSNHLGVNRLRGQVPRNDRLCKYCTNINKHHVEDEYHFIMECPLYREVRTEFLSDIVNVVNIHRFSEIMSSCKQSIIRKLAVYTYHAFKLHKNFMMI